MYAVRGSGSPATTKGRPAETFRLKRRKGVPPAKSLRIARFSTPVSLEDIER
jgi:hypothetical protein